MKTMESLDRAEPKKQLRTCKKCGAAKGLDEFYSNRGWKEMYGHDIWCKDCVRKCVTKDEIMQYFWENHREWNERIWDAAKAKAEKIAINNDVYNNSSDDVKRGILERLTCGQVPLVMGAFYQYKDTEASGKSLTYEEAKKNGEVIGYKDENIKQYSKKFNGYFKPAELEYLEEYYRGLENDFDLNDTNLRDIAKKLAKASMQADEAQDDYAAGRCDFTVVKDALAQFDMLSKSGNFAACKRKTDEKTGMSSWSELTYKLETTGHPCLRKIEWEPDDVDKTIAEFSYLVESLGLDRT